MSTKRLLNKLPEGGHMKAQEVLNATVLLKMFTVACIR